MSPSWFAGWQERYIHLVNRKITYFKEDPDIISWNKCGDRTMPQPLGVINFDHFWVKIESPSTQPSKEFNLSIHGFPDRIFRFKAQSI
jgi:hypothetical protein